MNNYIKEFPDVIQAGIFDMQALRYGIGGHYNFHVDDGPTFTRKYSSILMLNNDFKGGNLCFNLDGNTELISTVLIRNRVTKEILSFMEILLLTHY